MVSLRRFTSLCITFSFLIMTYTGIMLFIVPQGKYAYWMHWKLWGLSKTQYGNLHVTFMVLFLLGMILHLYLNWKPLVMYLKNKQKEFTLLTKEFIFAFGFTLIFFIGTLAEVVPFSSFLSFNDDVKQSWVTDENTPPYGHAELSSLKSLTKKTFIDLDKAIQTLKENDFKGVEPTVQLEKLAILNNTTPSAIYALIDIEENEVGYEDEKEKSTAKTTKVIQPQPGSGLGQMSLAEISKRFNVDLDKAIDHLRAKNIQADENSRLKPLAEKLNTNPMDLFDIISE